MIDKEILKAIIVEGQELLSDIKPVERAFKFEAQARYVFVGVRQAGKSFLMYLRAKELIAAGKNPEEFLFINFDDERLLGFEASDFDSILQAYSSLYDGKPILFLDEIQNIEGWEHFARRMANQRYMTYITGSNAKMLSRDIATRLGGRFMEQRVFPYSFREYLRANSIEPSANWKYGKEKGGIERCLTDYFRWGGFPELTYFSDKRKWLNELYDKIILSDIIQRNSIKNEDALRLFVRRLAENIKTPTSYNRLANIIKATGVSTNTASIAQYADFCRDSCLLFPIENYASKFVERASVKKHYFVDNGLLNIFLIDSDTALMENICALTLYRNSFEAEGNAVYFYNKETEIDFYLPERRKAIQASYSISDSGTLEREVKALVDFHRKYGLDEAEIITYSESRTIEAEGLAIRVISLAEWLLSFPW